MPFASKFRAMMGFPFAGDSLAGFVVESVAVRDAPGGPGRYVYPVRMVLRGPGGQQGVRGALKELFSAHRTTFSGYGNPYQLWFGKPEIEPLGDQRYAVTVEGAGARVYLEEELARFLAYLDERGELTASTDALGRKALVEAYLEGYRAEVKRLVDRYRRRLGTGDVPETTRRG
ncbi:MAG: hypothetical protein FJZ90_05380 [Chloroflexi bacterium]|nr:hypothetical protein [Chloroflexota bacterium]